MLDLYLIMIATPLAAFLHPLLPNVAVVFNVKFMACIALLILVRGGTPRYRYDYLTKLG
jgi:NADH:ubiquinone oxidoreductase subunit H